MIGKIIVLVMLVAVSAKGYEQLPEEKINLIANAIYKIEGGNQTKYPYGIRSIDCAGNTTKAKLICCNTIRNNYLRWQKTNKTNDFITFLGNIYCPTSGNLSPAEKKLNKNWIGNLKRELNKK